MLILRSLHIAAAQSACSYRCTPLIMCKCSLMSSKLCVKNTVKVISVARSPGLGHQSRQAKLTKPLHRAHAHTIPDLRLPLPLHHTTTRATWRVEFSHRLNKYVKLTKGQLVSSYPTNQAGPLEIRAFSLGIIPQDEASDTLGSRRI